MHPPVVVPLTKKVDEMFDFFQNNQARSAAVLNEFGGVEGFLTMKDVLTFIFGEISGEIRGHEYYEERDGNCYDVPGDMKLNDFNNLTNFGIEDPRMTTIGGIAFRHLDRLPRVGDKVTVEGVEITVTEMDGHRISATRVARGVTDEEADETPSEAAVAEESAEQPLITESVEADPALTESISRPDEVAGGAK
jgi:CBS domain containing-hemolysin-like protein